jgi:hypothetical protein
MFQQIQRLKCQQILDTAAVAVVQTAALVHQEAVAAVAVVQTAALVHQEAVAAVNSHLHSSIFNSLSIFFIKIWYSDRLWN